MSQTVRYVLDVEAAAAEASVRKAADAIDDAAKAADKATTSTTAYSAVAAKLSESIGDHGRHAGRSDLVERNHASLE